MNLYCTGDSIGTPTGGGAVTYHELQALKSLGEVQVISREELSRFSRQVETPFLLDYFALGTIWDKDEFKLAHFYSWGFPLTVLRLREKGTLVTYTVPAHDRRVTVEEFKRLGLDYPFDHIRLDFLWQIFSRGYREANVVIAPSQASAQFLREEGCPNVVVIPHGCDIPEKVAPPPNGFHVGYLGQVGPDKGLIYLLKAWEMINYRDSTLFLAGAGTEQLGPYIKQSVGRGNFRAMGFVESPSILYNGVSCYIQSSVCESFGIEVLEAMAHGRPVIVSEGAGASELVAEGLNGFVVPIRDPKAIAERVDFLKRNPQKAIEMGMRGREKAKEFTWDKIEQKYRKLWESL